MQVVFKCLLGLAVVTLGILVLTSVGYVVSCVLRRIGNTESEGFWSDGVLGMIALLLLIMAIAGVWLAGTGAYNLLVRTIPK